MQRTPKISILMSTYNHENYVAEAIESVLNQTFKDYEFIICDDASTDGTVDKIIKYEKEIDEIYMFDENKGTRGDFLCEQAKGEYIAIINSDDVWAVDKLEKQMKVLQENPDAIGCFTWCDMIDENGNFFTSDNPFNIHNRKKEEWLNHFFFKGNCFAHSSVLMRRDVYCKYREKNLEKFRQLPDFYMWIRIVQEYEIILLEEKLTKIRVVNETTRKNVSAKSIDNLLRHYNEEAFVWYKNISEMDDLFFLKAFKAELLDIYAQSKEEVMCEKFFALLRTKLEYCKIAAILYFYEYYDDMKECLLVHYGFTNKEFYNIVSDIGPAKMIKENSTLK